MDTVERVVFTLWIVAAAALFIAAQLTGSWATATAAVLVLVGGVVIQLIYIVWSS